MISYAPIALFVYKRPEHTRKTIESLLRNKEFLDSPFYVFCDGARSPMDVDSVQQTRNVVRSFEHSNFFIDERNENLGLAESIIKGVSQLCEQYGSVIVLEDDLIVSDSFLEYMNTALNKYANEPNVMQISGYMFSTSLNTNYDALFLPFPTSWGWATWQDSWLKFNSTAPIFSELESNKELRKKFNLDGSYNYYKILKYHFLGKVDSWAILWYASVFELGGLTLCPKYSLVLNIGFDGSGEHCPKLKFSSKNVDLNHEPKTFYVKNYPNTISVDKNLFSKIKFRIRLSNSWLSKLFRYFI